MRRRSRAARARTRHRWLGLCAVLLAAFMQLLDVTVVNVAAPTIRDDLGASYTQVQWVVASYQLAFAAGLLTGGRLGDVMGRRRVFVAGVLAFVLASLLCGLAQGPASLVAARVAQGLAGAVMFPQVLSTIHTSFSESERKAAFGMFGATVGLATVSGPLISGALVEWDVLGLGWRPIFFLNVPIGIAAVLAALAVLPESRATGPRHLDLPGAALASLGLLLLVYPLIQGREAGWPAWTWASLAGSVLLLRLFWTSQVRLHRGGRPPLVDVDLVRRPAFRRGLLLSLVLYVGVAGFFFVLAVYLQAGFGRSALQAGLTLLPFAVGSTAGSGMAIALAPRLGRRVLHGGAALLAAGFALFAVAVHGARDSLGSLDLLPAFLVAGVGLGALLAPLSDAVLHDVPHESAGAASGVLTTVQQVGGAVGVALMGVLFFGQVSAHADEAVSGVSADVHRELAEAGLPGELRRPVAAHFDRCFVERARGEDPRDVPPSCAAVLEPVPAALRREVGPPLAALATTAQRHGFATAMTWAGVFQVAVFAVTAALVPLLPDRLRYLARHRAAGRAGLRSRRPRGWSPR